MKENLSKADRKRALEVLLAGSIKKHGTGSIVMNNKGHGDAGYPHIPTKSWLLDDAIGIGGWPRGLVVELYGDEGCGKTTIANMAMAQVHAMDKETMVAFIDVEQAYNWDYAQELGIDPDRTAFSQPASAEEAIDNLLSIINSGLFEVVVLDSVAALRTKRQLEGEIGAATMGEVARIMSENMPKIVEAAKRTGTLVIFINQVRVNIAAYGAPNTTTGGKALKFYASVRADIKKTDILVDKDKNPIGQAIKITIRKNRVGVPFKVVETELFFGKGFNEFKEVIDLAIVKEIIKQGGAYYSISEDVKFKGKEALIQNYLVDDKAYADLKLRVSDVIKNKKTNDLMKQVEKV